MNPIWLSWPRELQAIAKTGLAYSKYPYDEDRYRAIRSLAARIMAEHSETEFGRIQELFSEQAGYATPKVDVRGAVFSSDGLILLVREKADSDCWTLPGGWAHVNESPSESVIREIGKNPAFRAASASLQRCTTASGMVMCRRMRFTSTSCSSFATS
jgi:Hydrolase of X-linked nucleoside diphosphate N terminal